MRATEYIEEDWNFISLFGLDALDVIDAESMWTNMQIIQSARGGGKTSILRIFSPKSLKEIHASRNSPAIKNLHARLNDLGAFSEKGPQILGVYLPLFGNYPILEQLEIGKNKQKKLFSSLVMCRVIMATLRSVCELKELKFPELLKRIVLKHPTEPNVPNFVKFPCSGEDLYAWAVKTEQKIFDIIDDESNNYAGLGMHENLVALHVIKAENIFCDGEPVAKKTLLMLDDLDRLTPSQRTSLSDTLAGLRVPIGLWMAERLEGLRGDELLSLNGTVGRECNTPIVLEKFWRARPSKFESLLKDISDKRARLRANNISFESNLQDHLESDWDQKFESAMYKESQRIIEKFDRIPKYKTWIERCKNKTGTSSQRAEEWRKVEIIIERDKYKSQKRLFEEEPLEYEEFESSITSRVTNISEYYIRRKYGIPYYFGFKELVKLSSSNIEQFLELSSSLFDDMISALYTLEDKRIKPKRQEYILRREAFNKWKEIERTIPHAQHVIPFLRNVAEFCNAATNTTRASYESVTGIAISTKDLKKLNSDVLRNSDKKYQTLYDVLATCIAHNLLEIIPETKQGSKGTRHFLMYLNRLLCLIFELPLYYGGWREQKIGALCNFIDEDHRSVIKTQKFMGMEGAQA